MASTRQTADWLAQELRGVNPHRHEPTNIQLAWSTGYLLGMVASLINEDTLVRNRVKSHFEAAKRPGAQR